MNQNPFVPNFGAITDWAGDAGYQSYMGGFGNALSGLGSAFGSIGDALFGGGSNSSAGPSTIKTGSSTLGNYAGAGSSGGNTILSGGLTGGKAYNPYSAMGVAGGYDQFGNRLDRQPQSQNQQGFDPWAGNPYAAGMAQNIWQGFLNNGNVAGQTSDAIWQTMQFNQQNKLANDVYGSQYAAKLKDLDNQKAMVDGQIAALQAQNDLASQKQANELKMFSDQLAAQKAQFEGQLTFLNSQLAQQGQLGNRQIDSQDNQANAQLQALLAQMQQQFQLGNRQLDIQDKQGTDGQAALDLQKWMFQQQQAQQNADRDTKNSLIQAILSGGGFGGIGGGAGSGGSGAPAGGTGFTGPQGQYAINTGVTAGGLNPGTIRAGVSAIEGTPTGGANMAGSRIGMTGAQQNALAQDMGSLNFAGGQAAATDAARQLLPENARLSLASTNAQNGMNLDYAGFVSQQNRARKGEQLGQQQNLYDLIRSVMSS